MTEVFCGIVWAEGLPIPDRVLLRSCEARAQDFVADLLIRYPAPAALNTAGRGWLVRHRLAALVASPRLWLMTKMAPKGCLAYQLSDRIRRPAPTRPTSMA